MNGYFLLTVYCLVCFVKPGFSDTSTEGCFCEVSTGCDSTIALFCVCLLRDRPALHVCSLQLPVFEFVDSS